MPDDASILPSQFLPKNTPSMFKPGFEANQSALNKETALAKETKEKMDKAGAEASAARIESGKETDAMTAKASEPGGALAPFKPKQFTPPPPTDPWQLWGSPAMLMAGISGFLGRRSFAKSLDSAAKVMNASKQNDKQAYDLSFEEWKIDNENAMRAHDHELNIYNTLMKQAGSKLENKLAAIQSANSVVGNEGLQKQMDLARQAGLSEMKLVTDYIQKQQTLAKDYALHAGDLAKHKLVADTIDLGNKLHAPYLPPEKKAELQVQYDEKMSQLTRLNEAEHPTTAMKGATMMQDKAGNLYRSSPSIGMEKMDKDTGAWVPVSQVPEGLTKLGAGQSDGQYTPQEWDKMFDQYLVTQKDPHFRYGSPLLQEWERQKARIMEERHIGPDELRRNIAKTSGAKTEAQTLGRLEAKMVSAAKEAESTLPLAREAWEKVQRTGFVPFDELARRVNLGLNNEDERQLLVASEAAITSYAATLGRGNATLTEGASKRAHDLLENAVDAKAANAALDQMQKDIDVVVKSPGKAREVLGLTKKTEGSGTGETEDNPIDVDSEEEAEQFKGKWVRMNGNLGKVK